MTTISMPLSKRPIVHLDGNEMELGVISPDEDIFLQVTTRGETYMVGVDSNPESRGPDDCTVTLVVPHNHVVAMTMEANCSMATIVFRRNR